MLIKLSLTDIDCKIIKMIENSNYFPPNGPYYKTMAVLIRFVRFVFIVIRGVLAGWEQRTPARPRNKQRDIVPSYRNIGTVPIAIFGAIVR